ncbi:MAG: hypothetical protein HYV07_08425 [Deltaproteobacteria bacterium]|nr:hypothetical protein [Deltaproteobacteria bacterium]
MALYAANRLELQQGARVSGGDVAVAAPGSPVQGVRALLGQSARIDPAFDFFADSVSLRQSASVGDVFTSDLDLALGATHGLVGPFPSELPALPSAGPVVSSSVAITVPQSIRLAPGSFGAVNVQHAAVLELEAGAYSLDVLRLGEGARLEVLGRAVVRVASEVSVGGRASLGRAPGLVLSANDLRIEVAGVQSGAVPIVTLGESARARALGGGSQSKARFATSNPDEVRGIVQEALRSPNAQFLPNPNVPGTFRVVTDLERAIGVKGQQSVRAIVGLDGKVINAFPVHVR